MRVMIRSTNLGFGVPSETSSCEQLLQFLLGRLGNLSGYLDKKKLIRLTVK